MKNKEFGLLKYLDVELDSLKENVGESYKNLYNKKVFTNYDEKNVEFIKDFIYTLTISSKYLSGIIQNTNNRELSVSATAFLTYLLNPVDIIPQYDYGFCGYIDDALLLFKFIYDNSEKISESIPEVKEFIKKYLKNYELCINLLNDNYKNSIYEYTNLVNENIKKMNNS